MVENNKDDKKNNYQLIKNQFSRVAEKYSYSPVHARREDLDYAISLIKLKNEWKVIDLATGTANFAIAIAPHVDHVLATDITEKMLEEAKMKIEKENITNINLEIADVHNLPYEKEKFDLSVVRIAPHHFHDIQKAIHEMVRVTKKDGFIFIEDTLAPSNKEAALFFNRIEILRDPSHVRDLTKDEWIKYIQDCNCEVLKVETKPKKWPLTWWTDQMKTSNENIREIKKLISKNFGKFSPFIDIRRFEEKNEEWTIYPNNIYLLAKKTQ